jgi:hypothetical protein
MHKGEVAMFGDADGVIDAYSRFMDVGETDVALEDL